MEASKTAATSFQQQLPGSRPSSPTSATPSAWRGVRGASAGNRLPRGSAQARAVDGRQRRGGRLQQRARNAAPGGSRLAAGVEHFVLISTDKAVNPTSVMGATKRVAELIVQEAAAHRPRVRGRALRQCAGQPRQRGALFQRQIAAGGPVTVTHPEVQRYFMTIPEAVQLVLQAAALGRGGEIFVLDMGEPVRIVDLARDLIRLSGLEPGRDIEIRYTGLRPGEKLFEELFGAGEDYGRTRHEKIFVCRNGADVFDAGAASKTSRSWSTRCLDPRRTAG